MYVGALTYTRVRLRFATHTTEKPVGITLRVVGLPEEVLLPETGALDCFKWASDFDNKTLHFRRFKFSHRVPEVLGDLTDVQAIYEEVTT